MAKLQLTPAELLAQSTELINLKSQYDSLFSGTQSILNDVNQNWSENLANNFSGKINTAMQSCTQISNMLSQGASAARTSALTFQSVDKQLAYVMQRGGGRSSGGGSSRSFGSDSSDSGSSSENKVNLGMNSAGEYSVDPVNVCNGNYVYEKTCLELDTVMHMRFRIFYNIQNLTEGVLGIGWVHTYEWRLFAEDNWLSIQKDDGSRLTYYKGEEKTYMPVGGIYGVLEQTLDGYILHDYENFTYTFNMGGKLIKKEAIFGDSVELFYEEENLCEVQDNVGNRISFEYNEKNKLCRVSDSTGRTVTLEYENGMLHAVMDSIGRKTEYSYDAHGWLSQLTNARGIVALKNEYDHVGRTVKQEFSDGGVVTYEYHDETNQVLMTEQNGNKITYEHDRLFRGTKNNYEDGRESFTYDQDNHRTSFTDKRGNTSYYSYDKNGNMVSFKNPLDDEITLTYTEKNQVESISINGTMLHRATYNEQHLLVGQENALGAKQQIQYDAKGQPIVWIQADGSRVEMTYDVFGNLTSITNAMGGRTVYEYDEKHRVIRTIDPLSNFTEYKYNAADELIAVKNAQGYERIYDYDACGNLIYTKDFNGGETTIEYNTVNKPIRIRDPEGNIHGFEYNKMWQLQKYTAADGGETSYEYNHLHRLARITGPDGAITSFVYDECGNLVQRMDPNGGVYKLAYDCLNRPKEVIDPCGRVVRCEYDTLGNVVKVIFEDGTMELCEYNVMGEIISFTDRCGYRKNYSYDLAGNVIRVEDEKGVLEEYDYYAGGLLKSEKLINGIGYSFEYDANENIVKATNQDGNSWYFSYDSLGRVTHVQQDEGITEFYEYDMMGNIVDVINSEGKRTSFTYSLNGTLKSIVDELGHEIRYAYDPCQRLIRIMQPESDRFDPSEVNAFNEYQKKIRTTIYTRDATGRVIKVTDPEGHDTVYTYDGCGNITSQLDEDGNLLRCEYNPDGTVHQYLFADGRSIKMTYNALKQLSQMEDWIGITKLFSDPLGRITKIESSDGTCINYEIGRQGERKSITYPDGRKTVYKYDQALRVISSTTEEMNTTYSYYDNGKLKEKYLPNGYHSSYRYYVSGKIAEVDHQGPDGLLESYQYQYDRQGRKTWIKRNYLGMQSPDVYEYIYDGVGRLTEVQKNGEEEERYSYDTFGNRVHSIIKGQEISYQYNRLNQLTTMWDGNGEHNFFYDKRGNLKEEVLNGKIVKNIQFGVLNLVESITTGKRNVNYQYDGFGNRIRQTVNDENGNVLDTVYIYDVAMADNRILSVVQNQKVTNILWDGGILGNVKEAEQHYYMTDELMSPRLIIGDAGIISNISYDSFGNSLCMQGTDEPIFGFTGYRPDPVSGFSYAGNREYDSRTGRFISRDPFPGIMLMPITLNAYMYCMGDPVNYVDPTGAVWAALAGGIVGAIGNVAVKAAGDVVKSAKNGKVQVSSWQSYVGSATGGFASGTTFVLSGGNMTLAGASGSAVETLTTEGLNMATGMEGYRKEDGYTWKNLIANIAVSGAKGAATGFAFGKVGEYIKLPGINSGKGSFEAVWKQVMTKAARDQIANITWSTVGKGAVAYGIVKFSNQVIKKGIDEIKSALNNRSIEMVENITDSIGYSVSQKKSSDYLGDCIGSATCTATAG